MSVCCTRPSWAPAVAPRPQGDQAQSSAGGVRSAGGWGKDLGVLRTGTQGSRSVGLRGAEQRERERTGTGWWTGHAGRCSAAPDTPALRVPCLCCPRLQSFVYCGHSSLGHRVLSLLDVDSLFKLKYVRLERKATPALKSPCWAGKPGAGECTPRTPPVAPWSLRDTGQAPSHPSSSLWWGLLATLQPGARESPASSTPGHRNPCDQRLQPARDSVVWRDSSAPCRQLAESLHITATIS